MKKVLILLMTVYLLLTLVSCGSSDKKDTENIESSRLVDSEIEISEAEKVDTTDFSVTDDNIHEKVKEIIEAKLAACKENDFEKYLDLINIDLITRFEPESDREALSEKEKDNFNDFADIYKKNSEASTEITLKLCDEPIKDDNYTLYYYTISIIGYNDEDIFYDVEAMVCDNEVAIICMEIEN